MKQRWRQRGNEKQAAREIDAAGLASGKRKDENLSGPDSMFEGLHTESPPNHRIRYPAERPSFYSDPQEARRNLDSLVTPMPIEEWAGAVTGAADLERDLGIKSTALHSWREAGQVIALPDGTAGEVYPLEQFVGSRPVPGLDKVMAIIEKPRVAWLWLVRPHPRLKRRPIDALKAGDVDTVVEAANSDYGEQI